MASFLQGLRITSGAHAGEKMRLRSWRHEALRALYATDADGRRLIRTAVASMGRKAGKTTLAAGLALCYLAGPEALLRWAVSNASVEMDPAGNRKLSKLRSRGRIDPLIAAVMAIGQAAGQPEPITYDFDRPLVLSA